VQSQSADKHLLRSNEQKATPSGAAINIFATVKGTAQCYYKMWSEIDFYLSCSQ